MKSCNVWGARQPNPGPGRNLGGAGIRLITVGAEWQQLANDSVLSNSVFETLRCTMFLNNETDTALGAGLPMCQARTLTGIRGATFANPDEGVRQGAAAALPGLVQLDQLQSRSCHGREAVELEGEVHGLRPRRSLVVLGHPEPNKAPN